MEKDIMKHTGVSPSKFRRQRTHKALISPMKDPIEINKTCGEALEEINRNSLSARKLHSF